MVPIDEAMHRGGGGGGRRPWSVCASSGLCVVVRKCLYNATRMWEERGEPVGRGDWSVAGDREARREVKAKPGHLTAMFAWLLVLRPIILSNSAATANGQRVGGQRSRRGRSWARSMADLRVRGKLPAYPRARSSPAAYKARRYALCSPPIPTRINPFAYHKSSLSRPSPCQLSTH